MGNVGKGVGNVGILAISRIYNNNISKSLLKLDPPQAAPQGTSYNKLAILYRPINQNAN